MDARPPPEVTIEGGPGWQLEGPRDALGPGDDDVAPGLRGPWLDRHRTVALTLAALVGFAAATALAEARLTTLEESSEGVLSLEVDRGQVDDGGQLVSDSQGRTALRTSVVVRNTGPRPVGFERAELLGTPYRSEDLAGRRVAAGGQTVITLLRPLDCGDLARTRAPGPLRVEATTGAGQRTVELRIDTDVVPFHDEQARAACGLARPEHALVLDERRAALQGAALVLDLVLANASGRPLSLESLTAARGLRLASVTTAGGAPVPLPLVLGPGDYDPPVEPYEGRGPEVEVSVRLEVEDCALYAPRGGDLFEPTLTLRVADGRAGTDVGTDPAQLRRLRQAACDGAVAAPAALDDDQLAEDAAERRYSALQRDHPFLTPD